MDAAHSKKSREKHFAPRHGPAQCDVHLEMRSRKYIHMLRFVYEDGIKIILRQYMNFISVQSIHQQASPVSWDYPFKYNFHIYRY
jgi:hypothetical protein